MALRTTLTDYAPAISQFLQAGGCARFLLVEPQSASSDVIARSFFTAKTQGSYSRDIEDSLTALAEFMQQHPDQVEVRLLDYVPSVSLTIFDVGQPSASALLELYTYATMTGRPHMQLRPDTSPQWYHYFVSEYELLWKKASPWYRML